MKYIYRINILLIIVSTFASCEKHDRDFRMENSEFIVEANQQLLYQSNLDDELLKIQANQALSQLAIKRQQTRNNYLQEIKSKVNNWPVNPILPDPFVKELEALRSSSPAEHDKLLLRLIVMADQNLIGLHVKSSGSAGLKNVDLRNWVEQKLPALREKLNESQSQWNKM